MSTALQCPACGFNHRLDVVPDAPVFSCARCRRTLKVPDQYRAGAAPPPGRKQTPARSGGSARKAPWARVGSGRSRVPVRILVWVASFVLGGVVLWALSKWTGFVGGDTLVDLLIDSRLTTYLRLAVLIPVWALFATLFVGLFLEGPRWWARRRAGIGAPKPAPRVKAAPVIAGGIASKPDRASPSPRRVPPRVRADAAAKSPQPTRTPEPVSPPPGARAPEAAAAADEFGARAAAGQRPRRIPRRDART